MRAEGEQPPIGIVFRGKGMRLSEEKIGLGILLSKYIFKKILVLIQKLALIKMCKAIGGKRKFRKLCIVS